MYIPYYVRGTEIQKMIYKQYSNKLTKIKYYQKSNTLTRILTILTIICASFGASLTP